MFLRKGKSLKISVVLPVYGNWDLVHNRLNELFRHVPIDTEIIIVNDASPDEDSVEIVKWWKEGPLQGRLFAYKNDKNLGFGGTCNRGFDIAIKHGAEGICLLTTDVTVMSDFVTNVVTLLSLDNNILIGGEVLAHDTGWNRLPTCVVPYCNGWFLATHKDTWQKLGGFDPRFGLFDAEDLDLSTTAWWLGVKLVPVGAKLHHGGGKTVNKYYPDRERYTIHNIGLWREKWADREQELKEKIYG